MKFTDMLGAISKLNWKVCLTIYRQHPTGTCCLTMLEQIYMYRIHRLFQLLGFYARRNMFNKHVDTAVIDWLIDWLGRVMSHEHASGYMRHPCKGHGEGCGSSSWSLTQVTSDMKFTGHEGHLKKISSSWGPKQVTSDMKLTGNLGAITLIG